MPATERQMRFVHGVLRGDDGAAVKLSASERAELIEAGVVTETPAGLHPTFAARQWLRRARAGHGAEFASVSQPAAEPLPLLAPLARRSGGRPAFLASHHLEAGRRVHQLFDRAHLTPRTTMAYTPVASPGAPGGPGTTDITDMAASARKGLAEIHKHLPRDCAGVIIDVCGYEKGLQTVEAERGWPRRSAKLVLRIGLQQLAEHYGLMPGAVGPERGTHRGWREPGARPGEFY